ncbi:hypothetical protein KHC28_11335 [Ancylobacter sonchi]|uniref:hypothetical protein n=1 Tax=Ancylobacter sonchi TaxID=1937790 RepID=UPI001BD375FA|nr:hypothetical protein [Ancylobacter sonchi]MBS7534251.1 hypothetical protein [Ancylobacter sonchi]
MLGKLFRGAPAPSADLRAALAAIDEAALRAAVDHAEGAYRAALLGDDDRAIAEADTGRDRARRDFDKGVARAEELKRRLAESEAAERREAARQRVAETTARRDDLVRRWNTDGAKAAKLLAPLAADLALVEAEIERLNSALYSGSDAELAEALGAGIKGVRATLWGKYFAGSGYSITNLIALPPTKQTAPIGWPAFEDTTANPTVGG